MHRLVGNNVSPRRRLPDLDEEDFNRKMRGLNFWINIAKRVADLLCSSECECGSRCDGCGNHQQQGAAKPRTLPLTWDDIVTLATPIELLRSGYRTPTPTLLLSPTGSASSLPATMNPSPSQTPTSAAYKGVSRADLAKRLHRMATSPCSSEPTATTLPLSPPAQSAAQSTYSTPAGSVQETLCVDGCVVHFSASSRRRPGSEARRRFAHNDSVVSLSEDLEVRTPAAVFQSHLPDGTKIVCINPRSITGDAIAVCRQPALDGSECVTVDCAGHQGSGVTEGLEQKGKAGAGVGVGVRNEEEGVGLVAQHASDTGQRSSSDTPTTYQDQDQATTHDGDGGAHALPKESAGCILYDHLHSWEMQVNHVFQLGRITENRGTTSRRGMQPLTDYVNAMRNTCFEPVKQFLFPRPDAPSCSCTTPDLADVQPSAWHEPGEIPCTCGNGIFASACKRSDVQGQGDASPQQQQQHCTVHCTCKKDTPPPQRCVCALQDLLQTMVELNLPSLKPMLLYLLHAPLQAASHAVNSLQKLSLASTTQKVSLVRLRQDIESIVAIAPVLHALKAEFEFLKNELDGALCKDFTSHASVTSTPTLSTSTSTASIPRTFQPTRFSHVLSSIQADFRECRRELQRVFLALRRKEREELILHHQPTVPGLLVWSEYLEGIVTTCLDEHWETVEHICEKPSLVWPFVTPALQTLCTHLADLIQRFYTAAPINTCNQFNLEAGQVEQRQLFIKVMCKQRVAFARMASVVKRVQRQFQQAHTYMFLEEDRPAVEECLESLRFTRDDGASLSGFDEWWLGVDTSELKQAITNSFSSAHFTSSDSEQSTGHSEEEQSLGWAYARVLPSSDLEDAIDDMLVPDEWVPSRTQSASDLGTQSSVFTPGAPFADRFSFEESSRQRVVWDDRDDGDDEDDEDGGVSADGEVFASVSSSALETGRSDSQKGASRLGQATLVAGVESEPSQSVCGSVSTDACSLGDDSGRFIVQFVHPQWDVLEPVWEARVQDCIAYMTHVPGFFVTSKKIEAELNTVKQHMLDLVRAWCRESHALRSKKEVDTQLVVESFKTDFHVWTTMMTLFPDTQLCEDVSKLMRAWCYQTQNSRKLQRFDLIQTGFEFCKRAASESAQMLMTDDEVTDLSKLVDKIATLKKTAGKQLREGHMAPATTSHLLPRNEETWESVEDRLARGQYYSKFGQSGATRKLGTVLAGPVEYLKHDGDEFLPRAGDEVQAQTTFLTPWTEARTLSATKVGRGAFGRVFVAVTNEARPRTIAVKELPLSHHLRRAEDVDAKRRQLHLEVSILCSLDHPNIVKGLGAQYPAHPSPKLIGRLFMEYCSGGSLQTLLDSFEQQLDEFFVISYTKQLLSGVAFLHSRLYAHLDIKPGNIVLSADQSVIKLCDFGQAIVVLDESGLDDAALLKQFMARNPHCSGSVGTPGFTSPEYENIELFRHPRKVDVWQVATVLAVMLRIDLYPDRAGRFLPYAVRWGVLKPIVPSGDQQLAPFQVFFAGCFQQKAEDRFTAEKAQAVFTSQVSQ
eukprot:m.298085 g.298085  ORF g.298085 m.298085 type:complete len:1530 (-) comp15860_c0_seq3:1423-6012(-)